MKPFVDESVIGWKSCWMKVSKLDDIVLDESVSG